MPGYARTKDPPTLGCSLAVHYAGTAEGSEQPAFVTTTGGTRPCFRSTRLDCRPACQLRWAIRAGRPGLLAMQCWCRSDVSHVLVSPEDGLQVANCVAWRLLPLYEMARPQLELVQGILRPENHETDATIW